MTNCRGIETSQQSGVQTDNGSPASIDVAGKAEGSAEGGSVRLGLVLWSAQIGGAETFTIALAERLARLGVRAEVLIIEGPGPLIDRLSAAGVPYRALGFGRGRNVLRQPRRFTQELARIGPDGVLLPECGFLGAVLRFGGYAGPVVAVEHGPILFPARTRPRLTLEFISRVSGAWADDAQVAVSELVLARMYKQPHARRVRRIYNGVDPEQFALLNGKKQREQAATIVAGFLGRLVPGKGLDVLMDAVARANKRVSTTLLVAGSGPERTRLSTMAQKTGVGDRVQFLGPVEDVRGFWSRCDIAVVPTNTTESFCMAALEAMACSKPIVATRTGALTELIVDRVTGMLVSPGDASALADAIVAYARLPGMRREHAIAARQRAVEKFHIDNCAAAYVKLFASIARRR